MNVYEQIKTTVGDKLDDETIAKAAMVIEMATPLVETPKYLETLRYSSLRDVVEFCEANT